MEIIPAIDLMDGRCVRLRQGQYDQATFYDTEPVVIAKQAEQHGVRRLHLVDLDGARASKPVNTAVLKQITDATSLQVEFGGGLREDAHVQAVFDAGARYAVVGSLAVTAPETVEAWMQNFGPDHFILAADVRYGRLKISGWSEDAKASLGGLMKWFQKRGGEQVLCTDIGRDGMMQGPNLSLYRAQMKLHPELKVLASGGVASLSDLRDLKGEGLYGAVVGKALLEGRISYEDLQKIH